MARLSDEHPAPPRLARRAGAPLRLGAAALAAAGALFSPVPLGAESEPEPVREEGERGAVDWTRGLVIAGGAAAADLRARSPEVARVGAERRARSRARAELLPIARELALAGARDVAALVADDEGAAARLERAAQEPVTLSTDYGSDGSVRVRLGLPLEAVRYALEGPSEPPLHRDGPTGVLVRAGDAIEEPALGVDLVAGGERYSGPTLFARPPATRDPRLGDAVEKTRAVSLEDGELEVELEAETLARARKAGAMVIVVLEPRGGPG